ncbi:MAG TPA: hypothetical protein VND95_03830 [Stellaceae bacterium]|nr:hypothetical protein [Stellaceae bacterium]
MPGPSDGAAEAGATAPNAGAPDAGAPQPADAAATGDGTPARRSFRVPRRRRRHAPLAAAPSGPDAASGSSAPAAGDAAPRGEPATGPARPRNRRRRRTAPAGAPASPANAETAERRPRDGAAPSRADGERAGNRRDGGRDGGRGGGRDRGPRAGNDGRRDRRDGPPRRVERALYSVDSVVDRGFEDVEEDDGTRRVHWTIVKRTTADQVSRKPVAAAYVLQRDGLDSEFPSLGAARNAVNKTIVHPEKLTRSKAEYAAEKSGKK